MSQLKHSAYIASFADYAEFYNYHRSIEQVQKSAQYSQLSDTVKAVRAKFGTDKVLVEKGSYRLNFNLSIDPPCGPFEFPFTEIYEEHHYDT